MGFNICEWGVADPWNWGPSTGNSWRTSNDISFTQELWLERYFEKF